MGHTDATVVRVIEMLTTQKTERIAPVRIGYIFYRLIKNIIKEFQCQCNHISLILILYIIFLYDKILMNVRREPTIVIEGKELVQTLSDHSNVTVTKDMKAMEFAVSVSILKIFLKYH